MKEGSGCGLKLLALEGFKPQESLSIPFLKLEGGGEGSALTVAGGWSEEEEEEKGGGGVLELLF